ncbi:DUF1295-containing protein [Fragilaria crotonensis]|nr:DUF1295-containing protein [Fragilaria crotonensis]
MDPSSSHPSCLQGATQSVGSFPFLTKSHLHLDLIGTGAFAAAGILPFITKSSRGILASARIKLSSALVTVWGDQAGWFPLLQSLKDWTRCSSRRAAFNYERCNFWVFSFLWGLVASLPHTLGTTSLAPGLPITSYCGCALYAIGLAFETLADLQKWTFKQEHPGQFCNVGVWSLSQHPNWFGNLAIWSGIFLINAPALIDTAGKAAGNPLQRLFGARRMLIAFLSPLFLWALFTAQASGNLTPALELANKKYGHDPAYLQYVANTPLIIPNPFKSFS